MLNSETLILEAAKGLVGIVIKTGWDSGSKLLTWLGKNADERTQQLIFDASKQYAQNYIKRHGELKVLGMRKPVSLESIYTSVQLLSEIARFRLATIEEIERSFRRGDRRFILRNTEKKRGITIANQEQYLMVLGAPGVGKSTFLRKIGLEAFKGNKGDYQHSCIPVFIELKKFTEQEIDIKAIIAKELDNFGFPNAEKYTEMALGEGKLLILLDALDEVPTKNFNNVVDTIQNFVDRYDKNRFILACRTAARSNLRHFSDVVIAEFDDEQIEQFIYNWFQSDTDREAKTAEKCWNLLQKPENKSAKELAQTPLLLTFLCLVYDEAQNFPNNRSRLYSEALRILLEKWAAERRLDRDRIYEGFHIELEEFMLSKIAFQGFEQDRLFCDRREIVEQIKTFLESNLNAPQHLNGEAVLKAIAIQQGILVERAQDIYSFSHLTLQEYLTAQYIVDNNKVEHLVSNYLTNKHWKEVFLLVAGLMRGGTDELLLLMEKEAQKYLYTPVGSQKLVPLLRWAEAITTGSKGDLKPVAKRAIAYAHTIAIANAIDNSDTIANADAYAYTIAIADAYLFASAKAIAILYANARANAIAYANVNANALNFTYASANINVIEKLKSSANELEKAGIFKDVNFTVLIAKLDALRVKCPNVNEPIGLHKNFAKKIIETWLQTFHISPELVNLSKQEIEKIDNQYFYINYLMVQCKEAAVLVSPQTWEGIKERMLKAPIV